VHAQQPIEYAKDHHDSY